MMSSHTDEDRFQLQRCPCWGTRWWEFDNARQRGGCLGEEPCLGSCPRAAALTWATRREYDSLRFLTESEQSARTGDGTSSWRRLQTVSSSASAALLWVSSVSATFRSAEIWNRHLVKELQEEFYPTLLTVMDDGRRMEYPAEDAAAVRTNLVLTCDVTYDITSRCDSGGGQPCVFSGQQETRQSSIDQASRPPNNQPPSHSHHLFTARPGSTRGVFLTSRPVWGASSLA